MIHALLHTQEVSCHFYLGYVVRGLQSVDTVVQKSNIQYKMKNSAHSLCVITPGFLAIAFSMISFFPLATHKMNLNWCINLSLGGE